MAILYYIKIYIDNIYLYLYLLRIYISIIKIYYFVALNMSRNERHRIDKRASSSRAKSRGIFNCF